MLCWGKYFQFVWQPARAYKNNKECKGTTKQASTTIQTLQCPGFGRPFTYTETKNTKKRQTTTKHTQIIMSNLWPSVRAYKKQQGTQRHKKRYQTSSDNYNFQFLAGRSCIQKHRNNATQNQSSTTNHFKSLAVRSCIQKAIRNTKNHTSSTELQTTIKNKS